VNADDQPDWCRVHGTCVAVDGLGVLIRGPSGAGKSDLALRLIDGGAALVADDVVLLRRAGDRLTASLPAETASVRGRMEVRGVGILPVTCAATAPLGLVVDLVAAGEIERLPEPDGVELLGISVPRLALAGFEASAASKVRLAARVQSGFIIRPP
jgi:serine kinase of HPr protein (carbohydrate metabolism regulator)